MPRRPANEDTRQRPSQDVAKPVSRPHALVELSGTEDQRLWVLFWRASDAKDVNHIVLAAGFLRHRACAIGENIGDISDGGSSVRRLFLDCHMTQNIGPVNARAFIEDVAIFIAAVSSTTTTSATGLAESCSTSFVS